MRRVLVVLSFVAACREPSPPAAIHADHVTDAPPPPAASAVTEVETAPPPAPATVERVTVPKDVVTWSPRLQRSRIEAAFAAANVSIPKDGLTLVGYSAGASIAEMMHHQWPELFPCTHGQVADAERAFGDSFDWLDAR